MLSSFLTLDNANVTQKIVLLRADLNLSFHSGALLDATRLERIIPTLRELQQRQAETVILSHRGRPRDAEGAEADLSLYPLVGPLSEHLSQEVAWVEDCVGEVVQEAIHGLQPGRILLCENLRFHAGEEANDLAFARALANLGEIYVNEAFSCSHRAHASIVGIPAFLPAVAGPALLAEIAALHQVLEAPHHPVTAIIGGAKVSTKMGVIRHILPKVDFVIIGGGMANTFLAAQGYAIGQSLYEPDRVSLARALLAETNKILLPLDVRLQDRVCDVRDVPDEGKILDVGPKTLAMMEDVIGKSQTLLWNGPLGLFEKPAYAQGTLEVATLVALRTRNGAMSVAGGGETVAALQQSGHLADLTYVSTAGGAFLEWLEGKVLPGIAVLCRSRESGGG